MPVDHRFQVRHHHQVGLQLMWALIGLFWVIAVVVAGLRLDPRIVGFAAGIGPFRKKTRKATDV